MTAGGYPGAAVVVGTESARIIESVRRLLTDETAYRKMAVARNPFGDGMASDRIVDRCTQFLEMARTPASQAGYELSAVD